MLTTLQCLLYAYPVGNYRHDLRPWATPSLSMPRELYQRFKLRYPKHGIRSKVVARLVEMLLDGQIPLKLPNKTNTK